MICIFSLFSGPYKQQWYCILSRPTLPHRGYNCKYQNSSFIIPDIFQKVDESLNFSDIFINSNIKYNNCLAKDKKWIQFEFRIKELK